MTMPSPASSSLDHVAVSRWPQRAAADLLGLGLVLAVLVALPAAPSDLDRHQLPKESVAHLATWLAVLLARPALGRGLSVAARVGLAGCLVIAVLSSLFATNPWLALRATALTLTGIVAFTTAVELAAAGLGDRLLGWCGVAAAVGVATALAQAYGAQSIFFAATRAPGGTFGNRNFMAHFSAIAMPVVITLTFMTRRRAVAVLAALTVAALTVGIVLSRSRTAWLAAPTALATYLVLLVPGWRHHALPEVRGRALLLAAAMACGVIGAVALPNSLHWRDDEDQSAYVKTLTGLVNAKEGSGRGRLIQYRTSLALVPQHPLLGVGPGNWPIRFADVAPPNDPSWAYNDTVPLNPWPSSDWVALLTERGAGAVLAVLLLGAALLWRGARGVRAGGVRAVAGATLAAVLVATALEGSFDAILLLPAPLLLVALATGALLAESDPPHEASSADAVPSRWGLAAAAVMTVTVARSGQQSAAYLIAGSGRSITRLEWAARVDPTSYPIRIALALRAPCSSARDDARAALRLAPSWPAPRQAVRRCG